MDNNRQTIADSANQLENSGVQYRPVAFTNGVYEPTKPFKALMVTGAGNVNIVGLDGAACVLPGLVVGITHPLGGLKILQASTVATGIVAIF